jgi:hypothetical protein
MNCTPFGKGLLQRGAANTVRGTSRVQPSAPGADRRSNGWRTPCSFSAISGAAMETWEQSTQLR